MVIEDLSQADLSARRSKYNPDIIPHSQERFLAFAFDIILTLPIYMILSFPVVKKLNLVQLFAPQSNVWGFYFGSAVFLYFIFYTFYQAVFLYYQGATFGKMFFKMKVKSLNNQELTWGQCLARSFVWSFQWFFAAAPFLEVISHDERRAAHDRVAETKVVSLKQNQEHQKPMLVEKAFVRMLLSTGFMLLLLWTSTWIVAGVKNSEFELFSKISENNPYCSLEKEKKMDFESLLVTLMFDSTAKDCVDFEINSQFKYKKESTLTYVAALLSHQYDFVKYEKYKDLLCAQNAEWCAWAQLNGKFIQKKMTSEDLKRIPQLNASYLTQFWGVKVLSETSHFNESDRLLRAFQVKPEHVIYYTSLKFKNRIAAGDTASAKNFFDILSQMGDAEQLQSLQKTLQEYDNRVLQASPAKIRAPASEKNL